MNIMRTKLAVTIAAAALSVSACAADSAHGGGLAYGYGYDSPYGYSCYPNSYGYGYNSYGSYGLGDCGWYDGFFYPGFGEFVFDRHHHRHEMTMRQHDYFTRQARGPNGEPRVGLGSSGGAIPPSASRPRNGGRPSISRPAPGIGGARGSLGGARGGGSGGPRGGGHNG
jgi:hypothetical protein